MKILIYSTQNFERSYLLKANQQGHEINMSEERLGPDTAHLAKGYETVCIFMKDDASASVIEQLQQYGVKYIAVRAENTSHIDIKAAKKMGIHVANIPVHFSYSVAEQCTGMILALSRKLLQAHQQVHDYNFFVNNLVGSDLHGKTVGIAGTGKTGRIVAQILHGFGCHLLAFDKNPDLSLCSLYNVKYVEWDELLRSSDIITLHVQLNEQTRYLVDKAAIDKMKKGVMLINTSHGAIVHTKEILAGLDNGHIGYFGTDVYEQERGLNFYDYNTHPAKYDAMLNRLLSMPNVLITPHQAFATHEALQHMSKVTFDNITCWINNTIPVNELTTEQIFQ